MTAIIEAGKVPKNMELATLKIAVDRTNKSEQILF